MIKLYGVPISNNVAKVRYCLSYLGLDYELVETSPMKGDTQTDEFRQLNPIGKIPVIDIDGFTLFESTSINRYLAATNDSAVYPTDSKERAVVDAWTDFGSIHVSSAQGRVSFNRILAPILGIDVDESSIKEGLELLDKYLPMIDAQLAKNKYLSGDDFSLADINMLAILDPSEISRISLDSYTNIVNWRNSLKQESFYQKCYKDFTQFANEYMSVMAK